MSGKPIGEEVRRRFPRLTMSLVMAIIFLMISIVVPQTIISNILVPGLNLNAGFLVGTITWLFAAIFSNTSLIRRLDTKRHRNRHHCETVGHKRGKVVKKSG